MVFRGRDTEILPDGVEEAVRREFVGPPSQEAQERHLELMLAADAEVGTAATQAMPSTGATALPAGARARIAITFAAVLVALPVAFAGLALAGVRAPDLVDSAFETVGIDLPNQPPDEDDQEGEPARADQPGSQGSAGDSASGDGQGADGESSADGNGSGSNARPSHAQDGETGAPAHSRQGGQGGGTPPPHAQDGNGGPPPHAQGGAPKDPKPPEPESTEPTPKKPKPVAPEPKKPKPTKPDSTELESDQ